MNKKLNNNNNNNNNNMIIKTKNDITGENTTQKKIK